MVRVAGVSGKPCRSLSGMLATTRARGTPCPGSPVLGRTSRSRASIGAVPLLHGITGRAVEASDGRARAPRIRRPACHAGRGPVPRCVHAHRDCWRAPRPNPRCQPLVGRPARSPDGRPTPPAGGVRRAARGVGDRPRRRGAPGPGDGGGRRALRRLRHPRRRPLLLGRRGRRRPCVHGRAPFAGHRTAAGLPRAGGPPGAAQAPPSGNGATRSRSPEPSVAGPWCFHLPRCSSSARRTTAGQPTSR